MRRLMTLLLVLALCLGAAGGAPARAETLTAKEFLATYAAQHERFFDTLLPHVQARSLGIASLLTRDAPATDAQGQFDALSGMLAPDAGRIAEDEVRMLEYAVQQVRSSLLSAQALWADDAAHTGDERSMPFMGGVVVRNGEIVRLENTLTARYAPEEGSLSVSLTEEGSLLNHAVFILTEGGFIVQFFAPAQDLRNIPSMHILLTLYKNDGIIGIQSGASQPTQATGLWPYEAPQTLPSWFELEDTYITAHGALGEELTFDTQAREAITDASGLWLYELADGGATVLGSTQETDGHLVIPGALDGYPVTGIGRAAFENCTFTGVTIPDSVTHIDADAFLYCLELESVRIPGSVAQIGESAFVGCIGLLEVTLAEGVTRIGDYAFFAACLGMTHVTLPASVTSVGLYAFGPMAGDDYALTHIDVAPGNPRYTQIDGVLFDAQQSALVLYPAARAGAYAVPQGTLRIGEGAFSDCWELTEVSLPYGLTDIDDHAFAFCESLTHASLPGSVARIAEEAFYACEELLLHAPMGSYAAQYAQAQGIPCSFIAR